MSTLHVYPLAFSDSRPSRKLDTTQIVSQVVIIIGPAFLAAEGGVQFFNTTLSMGLPSPPAYMVVGRMMSFVGPNSTFISHMIITKIFVCVDIASLVTQSIGSAMLFQDDPSPNITILQTGRNVLIAGFVLQLGAFAIFTIIAILFHRKAWEIKGDKMTPLEPLFRVFYTAAVLVILRSTYRTIGTLYRP